MASYVDGFVIPMLKKNIPAYKKMALEGKKAWKKFGAIDYKECLIDDMKIGGQKSMFAAMVKLKPTETIVFSYIVFKSRAHRDRVNKQVMAYFSEKYKDQKDDTMPFDMKRMAVAGFATIVE